MKSKFTQPYVIKKARLTNNSIVITGRAFSLSAVAASLLLLIVTILMTAYFHTFIAIPIFLLLVYVQPYACHFSIHMSAEWVKIRWTYLGIPFTRLKAPFDNLIIVEIPKGKEKRKGYITIDFLGDWDTDGRYVTVTSKGKRHFFSTEMLSGGDNDKFETELWHMLLEAYHEVRNSNG